MAVATGMGLKETRVHLHAVVAVLPTTKLLASDSWIIAASCGSTSRPHAYSAHGGALSIHSRALSVHEPSTCVHAYGALYV